LNALIKTTIHHKTSTMKKTLLLNFLKAASSRNPRKNTTRFNGLLTLFIMVMGMGVSWGQISISSSIPVTESFTIGTSTTASLPSNWKMSAAGAGSSSLSYAAIENVTAVTQGASSSSPTAGGRYNWGNGATTTDRAIGFMTSGSYASPNSIMAFYRNTSGFQIDDITISFDFERYRINTAAASVTFFTSTNGTTWTARTSGDIPSGTFATGTNAYNFTSGTVVNRSFSISGVNIANNGDFYLMWIVNTTGGNSQGIGLDNVSLAATIASGSPSIAMSSPATPTSSINNNTTNNIVGAVQLDVTTANATLNGVTFTTAGTYTASDIATNGFKFWLSTSATDISGATQLGAAQAAATTGSNIAVSGLSNTINSGTTRYVVLSADIAVSPTNSATIGITSTAFSNITFASGTKTGTEPVAASTTRAIAVLVPSIAISGNHPTAASINQNATNQVFGSISLAVTTANTTLNSVAITTGGTYQTSDLVANSFKLYYTTTNTFATTTQLVSAQAIVASGNTITFTGLSQTINSGVTGYLWFTVDVAYNAVNGRTLSTASTVFSNISFASGNKTGADPVAAGNDHTITTVTPNITISQVGPSAGNIANNTTNQTLYQLSFVTADNATDINSLTITTAGTYVPNDLIASSFKLWYNSVNSLSGATQLGSDQAIVSTGNNITFSGLTQKFDIGTSYLLLTVDVASEATAANTINITSTPFTNITLSAGNKLGTDPSSAGGLKTIITDVSAGDVVINQFSSDYSGASNEYVEIVNKTGNTIDLSTLKLSYQSSSGSSGGAGATLSGSLAPYSFWLLSPDATITVGLTSSLARDGSFTAGFAATSGQLAIQRVSDNTIIDALGYGSLSGGTFSEGTSASSPPTDGGLRRVTDGADANANSTDFTTVTNANIYLRNSNSRLGIAGSTIGAGTFTDFVITGNTSLSGTVNVTNSLSLIGGTLTTGGNLTLKSDENGTARVSEVGSGGTVTGNVTVERYLPARRAWRLLTAPLKGSSNNSIYANWQGVNNEGVLLWHPNGNGTNGLSVGPQANIWSYSNGWNGNDVSNTNTSLLFSTRNNAYLVYATGPSNSNNIASNTGASITTLRPKGELITGTVNYTGLTADQFHLLGNPYASPIDVARLRTSNASYTFYLLDPSLGDANSRGGYYTYNGSWAPDTPSNALIQSGQGFFVKSASATTFDVLESHKDSGNSDMWFDRTTADTSVDKIRVLLYKQDNNSWYLADGILAVNSASGNHEVDAADADKMTNFNENLLFKNGTSNLAIEYRGLPAAGMLQPMQLTGTTAQAYQMRLKTENYSNSNLTPYLENIQTGVLTAIPTDGSEVVVPFTGMAATSAAPDSRFRIVYQAPLSADDMNSLVVGVYPNPVNEGLFAIELANTNAPASYTLTNLLGQEVQKGTLMALTNAIAVQDLSKGVYLLQINQEGKRFSTKLMIK
jgi:hypothetical protein